MKKQKSKAHTPKVEIVKRVAAVQKWIMDDHSRADIIRSVVSQWDVSERQAERYYKQAHDNFAESSKLSIDQKRAFYVQRMRKLIRDLDPVYKTKPSGIRAINKILDSMAVIEGVKVHKVELTDNTFLEMLKQAK